MEVLSNKFLRRLEICITDVSHTGKDSNDGWDEYYDYECLVGVLTSFCLPNFL